VTALPSGSINVVVAAPELSQRKGLNRCFSKKAGFLLVRCSNSVDDILSCCQGPTPGVLIISQDSIEGTYLAEFINILKFGRAVKVLVTGPQEIQRKVQNLLRAGALGFLESGCSNYMLRRAVRSVAAGELWASRQVVSRVIREFLLAESLQTLSPREYQILDLIGKGYKNREIAERLYISAETVHWHVRGLYAKIGVKDRLSAAVYAGEHIGPCQRMPVVRQASQTLVAAG
jgi:DNA-binding NarL/FixJ family response regulator